MITADLALSSAGDILLDNNDISYVYDDQLAVQMFNLYFRSRHGDFGTFPEIGMDLKDFTSQTNNRDTANDIQERIYSTITDVSLFDDYSIIVDPYPTDVNDLRLDMTLTNPDGKVMDLDFQVDLDRGEFVGLDQYDYTDHNIYTNDSTTRIEKVYMKTAGRTMSIKYRPYPGIDGTYSINIYTEDKFDAEDTTQTLLEDLEPAVDIETALEIDLTTTQAYTTIRGNYNIVGMTINGYDVDVSDLETNGWIYEITNTSQLDDIVSFDSIEVETYYNNTITTATLTTTQEKDITDNAIAPDIEDNRIYTITTRARLSAGKYFVVYESYITNI